MIRIPLLRLTPKMFLGFSVLLVNTPGNGGRRSRPSDAWETCRRRDRRYRFVPYQPRFIKRTYRFRVDTRSLNNRHRNGDRIYPRNPNGTGRQPFSTTVVVRFTPPELERGTVHHGEGDFPAAVEDGPFPVARGTGRPRPTNPHFTLFLIFQSVSHHRKDEFPGRVPWVLQSPLTEGRRGDGDPLFLGVRGPVWK